jgi:hypothetical protein
MEASLGMTVLIFVPSENVGHIYYVTVGRFGNFQFFVTKHKRQREVVQDISIRQHHADRLIDERTAANQSFIRFIEDNIEIAV